MIAMSKQNSATQIRIAIQFAVSQSERVIHRDIKSISFRHAINADQQHVPVLLRRDFSFAHKNIVGASLRNSTFGSSRDSVAQIQSLGLDPRRISKYAHLA